jgi:cysteine desulfurase/selenocysteine lyase
MLGPTGIGALYARERLLEAMPPFLGGGDMIKTVHLQTFTSNDVPHKFEAGTPAVAEAVGFGAAITYLSTLGMEAVATHERELVSYALERLEEIPGVDVLGPAADKKGGVAAFTLEGVHPHDVAQILDHYGVAVRAGHHCAQPLHEKFGITATTRASFYVYSMKEEVDKLVAGIYQVKKIFK